MTCLILLTVSLQVLSSVFQAPWIFYVFLDLTAPCLCSGPFDLQIKHRGLPRWLHEYITASAQEPFIKPLQVNTVHLEKFALCFDMYLAQHFSILGIRVVCISSSVATVVMKQVKAINNYI